MFTLRQVFARIWAGEVVRWGKRDGRVDTQRDTDTQRDRHQQRLTDIDEWDRDIPLLLKPAVSWEFWTMKYMLAHQCVCFMYIGMFYLFALIFVTCADKFFSQHDHIFTIMYQFYDWNNLSEKTKWQKGVAQCAVSCHLVFYRKYALSFNPCLSYYSGFPK